MTLLMCACWHIWPRQKSINPFGQWLWKRRHDLHVQQAAGFLRAEARRGEARRLHRPRLKEKHPGDATESQDKPPLLKHLVSWGFYKIPLTNPRYLAKQRPSGLSSQNASHHLSSINVNVLYSRPWTKTTSTFKWVTNDLLKLSFTFPVM